MPIRPRTTILCASLALLAGRPPAQEPARADLYVPAQRWALVVGAGDYEYLGRLRYATRDAKAFAGALVDRLGFAKDTVRLLTDDTDDPKLTPTAGHLIGELEALLADPRRNRSDLFVFYFCGHGSGLAGGDYLLPTDARRESLQRVGLPVKEIVDRLATAGMRNVLVLVDACREGKEHDFGRELWELADAARLSVVLGCEPGAQSYEDAFLGHGVFTHFLLESLADPGLADPASGALWASRVLKRATAGVEEFTARRSPRQRPAVWTDPTRDVLLGATMPAELTPDVLRGFVREAGRLSPEAHLAALARYAFALLDAGRLESAIAVLETAEQLGPLPPELAQALGGCLLQLGRSVEAGRVFRALRESVPESPQAMVATVCDSSGAVTDVDRAGAAAALWDGGFQVPLGLLMRMVDAQLVGGSGAVALEIARTAATQAPPGGRQSLYLAGVVAILERRPDDALADLERAEEAPGDFPTDAMLRGERLSVLQTSRGAEAALALLDDCIARWPEDGGWLARRAILRRDAASDLPGLDAALVDARAALERSLEPEELLLVVRAAGAGALQLADRVAARAAEHPLAWEAQIASIFARQPADLREEVAAAARLAARPALVYAKMGRLTLTAGLEQFDRRRAGKRADDPELAGASQEIASMVRSLYERLAPMAPDFGGDPEAWALIAELSQRLVAYEAFHRLFEHHFGAAIDAGQLPERLVLLYAESCLSTGRIERFRQGAKSLLSDRTDRDTLRWLEAAWLAVRGDDAQARELLGTREAPVAPRYARLGRPLRALLLARAGDAAAARALLGPDEPKDILPLCVLGLARRALGDTEAAAAILERVRDLNPENAFFVFLPLWSGEPGLDPRNLAQAAALYQPGNPLVHTATYAGEPELAAFAGTYEFKIEMSSGPVASDGADLTFTVTPTGRVLGELDLPGGAANVVRARVDAYGNFDGELVRDGGVLTLLAKLAPKAAHAAFPPLAQSGQIVQLLDGTGVPFYWICRPAW